MDGRWARVADAMVRRRLTMVSMSPDGPSPVPIKGTPGPVSTVVDALRRHHVAPERRRSALGGVYGVASSSHTAQTALRDLLRSSWGCDHQPRARAGGSLMRTPTRIASVLLALPALMAIGVATATADTITICHRTNSTAHPYTSVTTDLSEDHFDKHTGPLWNPTLKKWGDVIPPSEAHPDGSEAYQDLIELGMDPDAFIAQGCSTPLS